jgi:hypothetical protein
MDENNNSGFNLSCSDADTGQRITTIARASHSGVAIGLETMQGIKSRMYEGIVQQ